ncbi:MAG: acyltransferase [Saprospiraceae bacterium]|nr:acyltransferase [Saprospiraceae bacterium]
MYSLIRRIARFIFKTHGWKLIGEIPKEVNRCVFVFAPHTSNWDFYHGKMCMTGWGVPMKAAIKNFWTKFPFGLIIKPLGGVGIDRSKKEYKGAKGQVKMMANLFKRTDQMALVITPEGSRSRRDVWKTGFYHIAREAGVPIVVFKGDFFKKEIEFGPVYTGDEDLETIMRGMMEFYKDVQGRHPENFALDKRYV